MPAVACLTDRQLEDYSLGWLADADYRAAEAHIASCVDCGAALAAADRASDPLLRALHAPAGDNDRSGEGEYVRAAADVKRLAAVPAGDSDQPWPVSNDASPSKFGVTTGPEPAGPALPAELTRVRDYRLLRKLGEGGMGTVYKALHVRLDRVFALKVLPPDRMHDVAAVARFEREMRAAGRFDHPAIVRATDAGELDGMHFLVMEYVEGLDLARLVERTGPLPIPDACELIRQAALGLGHVHQHGMVHRDIKPSNLMLAVRRVEGSGLRDGTVEGSGLRVEGEPTQRFPDPQPSTLNPQPCVKILDLGLALLGGTHGTACELTTVGQFMGTLDYMAPEQADDSHDVDPRADIYSLGATLYRLLTGQAPFAGPARVSPVKKFKAVLLSPAPDVRELRPDVPPELAALIVRMLAKNPEDRPHTADDVARSLEDFCRGADLAALLARAEHHAPRETDAGLAGPLPPVSGSGGDSHGGHRPDEQPSVQPLASPRRTRLIRAAVAAVAVLLLAAAVFVIRIQTDKGELIIRSADPGVQVLVKRGGEPVDDWQLDQGENRTTVRSGQYEIVLLGNSDGLTIRDGAFTLTRGGEHVVTVERAEGINDLVGRSARSSTQPSYTGTAGLVLPFDPTKLLDSATQRDDVANSRQVSAQVKFTTPAQAVLTPAEGASDSLIIPVRIEIETGQSWRASLSNIPDFDAAELSVAVDMPPVTDRSRAFYQSMAVPIEISREDIERALGGQLVRKVFYVAENAEGVSSRTLGQSGLPPDVDGDIALAVLRLGNRTQIEDRTGSAGSQFSVSKPQNGSTAPRYGGVTYEEAKHILRTERKPEVVAEAIEAIGALADQASHAEALQLILDAAKHHGDPWIYGGPGSGDVRLKVVTTLQSHFDSLAGVEAIGEALSKRGSDVRPYLLMALGRASMGAGDTISPEQARHAVPGLLDATRDDDPRIAGMAMTLAGELAPANTRVRDVLREALSAKHPDVAWAAAYTLADVDPQAEGLVPALRQVIQQAKRPDWQRATAAEFLVRIEPDTEELVAALIELVSQKASVSTDIRGRALVALSKLGARAAPAAPTLIEIVRDENSGHAWHPAPSFGQLGAGGSIARPGVGQPEVSKNHRVWAIEALGNIGPAAKDALPVLESITYTDSIEPAREAIRKITSSDASRNDGRDQSSPPGDRDEVPSENEPASDPRLQTSSRPESDPADPGA
jgi:serine/threonine protein kinase/HEAT repeat protein